MKRFHCIIFYLSVQLIALFYKYWFLLIFASIITITIKIIMSFNEDKHITFRH